MPPGLLTAEADLLSHSRVSFIASLLEQKSSAPAQSGSESSSSSAWLSSPEQESNYHATRWWHMWTCANYIRNVVARLGIARGRVQLSVQSGAGGGLGGGQVVSPLQVNGKWKYNYIFLNYIAHCRFAWDQFSLDSRSTIGVEFATRSLDIGRRHRIFPFLTVLIMNTYYLLSSYIST